MNKRIPVMDRIVCYLIHKDQSRQLTNYFHLSQMFSGKISLMNLDVKALQLFKKSKYGSDIAIRCKITHLFREIYEIEMSKIKLTNPQKSIKNFHKMPTYKRLKEISNNIIQQFNEYFKHSMYIIGKMCIIMIVDGKNRIWISEMRETRLFEYPEQMPEGHVEIIDRNPVDYGGEKESPPNLKQRSPAVEQNNSREKRMAQQTGRTWGRKGYKYPDNMSGTTSHQAIAEYLHSHKTGTPDRVKLRLIKEKLKETFQDILQREDIGNDKQVSDQVEEVASKLVNFNNKTEDTTDQEENVSVTIMLPKASELLGEDPDPESPDCTKLRVGFGGDSSKRVHSAHEVKRQKKSYWEADQPQHKGQNNLFHEHRQSTPSLDKLKRSTEINFHKRNASMNRMLHVRSVYPQINEGKVAAEGHYQAFGIYPNSHLLTHSVSNPQFQGLIRGQNMYIRKYHKRKKHSRNAASGTQTQNTLPTYTIPKYISRENLVESKSTADLLKTKLSGSQQEIASFYDKLRGIIFQHHSSPQKMQNKGNLLIKKHKPWDTMEYSPKHKKSYTQGGLNTTPKISRTPNEGDYNYDANLERKSKKQSSYSKNNKQLLRSAFILRMKAKYNEARELNLRNQQYLLDSAINAKHSQPFNTKAITKSSMNVINTVDPPYVPNEIGCEMYQETHKPRTHK